MVWEFIIGLIKSFLFIEVDFIFYISNSSIWGFGKCSVLLFQNQIALVVEILEWE